MDLREQVADSLDAEVAWWDILPLLFAEMPGMGGDPHQIKQLLSGLPEGARVLDLGCGTGAASRPLDRAGLQVHGVDGHEGLIASAKRRAVTATFEAGDLRQAAEVAEGYDAALLVAVGPVFGSEAATARALASTVRPGGRVVYDWEWHETTAPAFEAEGLRLVIEERASPESVAAAEAELQRHLTLAAEKLSIRHPEHAEAIEAYLTRQVEAAEREVATPCAVWLFERV